MKKLVLGLLLVSPSVFAASFDCDKAATFIENAICDNSEISNLDDTLSSSYRSALKDFDKADAIKLAQRDWIKKRNLCKNEVCLKNSYIQRIKALAVYDPLPKKVGKCVDSTISDKYTRFENVDAGEDGGGEVSVAFENELALFIQTISNFPKTANPDKYMFTTNDFALGDKVKLCLKELPTDCPKGDDRGKVYTVTNYKNNKSFVGIDSWHLCGGA